MYDVKKELDTLDREEAEQAYKFFLKQLVIRATHDFAEFEENNTEPLYRIIKVDWDEKRPGFNVQKYSISQSGYGEYEHVQRTGCWPAQEFLDRIAYLDTSSTTKGSYKTFGSRHSTYSAAERWLKQFVSAPEQSHYDDGGNAVN